MNETKWRMHWREARDGLVHASSIIPRWNEAKSFLGHWVGIDGDRAINWLQPDGAEPALKNGKEPIRWRVWFQSDDDKPRASAAHFPTRYSGQNNADQCNACVSGCTYWIQPELVPVEKPELAKPEQPNWRVYWISHDGKVGQAYHRFRSLQEALERISYFKGGLSGGHYLYWTQPDEYPSTLKSCDKPVAWRVWTRPKTGGSPLGISVTFGTSEKAESYIGSLSRHAALDYWIQPELAEAKAEPKAPEKPKLWRVIMVNIRGLDDKTPKDSGCVYATRAQAESRAYAFNLIQQNATAQGIEWRYWAEPVGEVKPEPIPEPAKLVEIKLGTEVAIDGFKATVNDFEVRHYPGTFTFKGTISRVRQGNPAPPKPYERRWTFSKIVRYTDGSHRVYFEDKTGLTVKVCNHDCLYLAYASANHLNGLDPKKADAEIDAIYAGQK